MVETWHRRSSQVGQERIEGVNVRNGQCKAVDEEKENMTSSTRYRMLRFIVLSQGHYTILGECMDFIIPSNLCSISCCALLGVRNCLYIFRFQTYYT